MPETLLIPLATIGGATIAAVASVLGVNRLQNGRNQKNGNQIVEVLGNILKATQEHNVSNQLFNQRVEEMFKSLTRDNKDTQDAIERHRKEL